MCYVGWELFQLKYDKLVSNIDVIAEYQMQEKMSIKIC
jgi:hypothetical protein